MKKKNSFVLQTLIVFFTISLPSQLLLSSDNNQKKPMQESTFATIEDEDEELDRQLNAITASTKKVQVATPTPGLFSRIYINAAPIILGSINTALGSGIGQFTKVLIKSFIQRRATFLAYSPEDQAIITKESRILPGIPSTSSIVNQAAYVGVLSTILPIFGNLVALIATMGLQTLMPMDNS